MRKFKFLFSNFLLLVLLISCSEENLEIGGNDVNIEAKQILELQLPEQRTAYMMASPEVKYFVWKQVLEKKINEEYLSPIEIKKMKELLAIIRPTYFESPTEVVDDKELIKWRDEAIQIFGRDKFILHFTKLNKTKVKDNSNKSTNKQTTDDGKEDCECNTSEDYCSAGFDCKSTDCITSTWGCGLLWNSRCNGSCL